MTSREDATCPEQEERRRSPLDQLPPPANSNKPLTPFSIEDILNKPSGRRGFSLHGTAQHGSRAEKLPSAGYSLSGRPLLSQSSPLCALEELASKTFKGLEVSVLQAAEGKRPTSLHLFSVNRQRTRSQHCCVNFKPKRNVSQWTLYLFKIVLINVIYLLTSLVY